MLRYFKCPDEKKVEIATCLKECPDRCLTLPTLRVIAKQRKWTGIPSVTQLLEPTRMAYLKITEDYAIDPDNHAFALVGTQHHEKLAKLDYGVLAEEALKTFFVTGIPDLLEEENSEFILSDYKLLGSFKIGKCLGLVGKKVVDPSGALYKKSGKGYSKGDPKMVTVFSIDENKVDMPDYEYQLNMYRILYEKIGFPIAKIRIQATCREGKQLWISQKRGMEKNINLIPVRRMNDDHCILYFINKREALLSALKDKKLPPVCSGWESWDGRRCEYCDVSEECGVPIAKLQPVLQEPDREESPKSTRPPLIGSQVLSNDVPEDPDSLV